MTLQQKRVQILEAKVRGAHPYLSDLATQKLRELLQAPRLDDGWAGDTAVVTGEPADLLIAQFD